MIYTVTATSDTDLRQRTSGRCNMMIDDGKNNRLAKYGVSVRLQYAKIRQARDRLVIDHKRRDAGIQIAYNGVNEADNIATKNLGVGD